MCLISAGREFHIEGPAKANDLSPTIFDVPGTMKHLSSFEERNVLVGEYIFN